MPSRTRPAPRRRARCAGVALLALLASACAADKPMSRTDSTGLAASGGVRADSGAVPMRVADYSLDRTRVDRWHGAQRALGSVPDDPGFTPSRGGIEIPASEVDRAVAYLESRPESRRAIERSGMSVRDYVLTTFALQAADRARSLTGTPVALPAGNLVYAGDYEDEVRRDRLGSGVHIVQYGDEDDDGDGDRRGRGHGHRHHRRHHGKHHDDDDGGDDDH